MIAPAQFETRRESAATSTRACGQFRAATELRALQPGRFTQGQTSYYLKYLLIPDVPENEGCYGPVRIVAPERPLADVLADVQNGYVSVEGARDDYSVVVDPDTLTVLDDETARLRGAR